MFKHRITVNIRNDEMQWNNWWGLEKKDEVNALHELSPKLFTLWGFEER